MKTIYEEKQNVCVCVCVFTDINYKGLKNTFDTLLSHKREEKKAKKTLSHSFSLSHFLSYSIVRHV